MKIGIQSFLWVASAYNAPGKPAYQVDVIEHAETAEEFQALDGRALRARTLNVLQAEEAGIDLKTIAAAINWDLAREVEQLRQADWELKEKAAAAKIALKDQTSHHIETQQLLERHVIHYKAAHRDACDWLAELAGEPIENIMAMAATRAERLRRDGALARHNAMMAKEAEAREKAKATAPKTGGDDGGAVQ